MDAIDDYWADGVYPNEKALEKVRNWDWHDPTGLIEFIEELWWHADKGVKIKGKKVIHVELHTWGWSGNEDIIGALRKNGFWILYWQKSVRGGHYYFKFNAKGAGK